MICIFKKSYIHMYFRFTGLLPSDKTKVMVRTDTASQLNVILQAAHALYFDLENNVLW